MFKPRPTIACRRDQFAYGKSVLHDNKTSIHVPFGLNLTTFTAPECLVSVERYSTRGGCGVERRPEDEQLPVETGDGKKFGRTSQI